MTLPLLCNSLLKLFDESIEVRRPGAYATRDPEKKDHLDLFLDSLKLGLWYTTNTLINFDTERIIHHPNKTDFNRNAGSVEINTNFFRRSLGFSSKKLRDKTLQECLSFGAGYRFMQQILGMEKPENLLSIGDYLGRSIKIIFPDDVNAGNGHGLYGSCIQMDSQNLGIYACGYLVHDRFSAFSVKTK